VRNGRSTTEVFHEARIQTRWHYQNMILTQFPPQITGQAGVDDILRRGRRYCQLAVALLLAWELPRPRVTVVMTIDLDADPFRLVADQTAVLVVLRVRDRIGRHYPDAVVSEFITASAQSGRHSTPPDRGAATR
jgi:hypothetical protein